MALVIEEIIAGITFIVYPTTFDRPEPVGKSPAIWVVKTVYKNDSKILSCLPSLHCGTATLFILGALSSLFMPLPLKLIIVTFSVLIILSTVFVKQHMIMDLVTAIPLSLLCWYIATVITPEAFLTLFKFI
jgi:membrane-associated phospholipid phosphatase